MIARVLYGALFTVLLPALLALWAWRLEPEVGLPPVREPWLGTALLVLGLALTIAGMAALWFHGGGLPMNAFPPPRLVERGIYWYLSQPIYLGFVIACAGGSILAGSRAGLWVVTPLVAAGCAALVWGYERQDLCRRFGTLPRPLIRLPSGGLALWAPVLWATERVANSWHDWRWGPVRIINHGAYAGLAALVGVAGIAFLAGRESIRAVVAVALCSLVGGGLLGQLLEGGTGLLRPFGYYGGALGAVAGVALVAALGADFWVIGGALAVMAPWIQLVGRFRCLVQGCCHGAPTGTAWGIRYSRSESRVCRIAHLDGVPVHPTPLYSMLGNVAIGIVLGLLWAAGAPLPMLAGLYLVLSGLARFVEEAYRGEPATPIVGGLRLYQWFALLSVVIGAIVMSFHSISRVPAADPSWAALGAAGIVGLVYGFAMGVDFPTSNRRFSRLA